MGIWKRPDGGRLPWRANFPHPHTGKIVRAPHGFATKAAATAWRNKERAAILASGGGYDPSQGRVAVGAFRRLVWEPQRQVAESTRARDRSLVPRLARWDDWPLTDIRPSHVRAWARELTETETPHVATEALNLFRGILQLAKEDGRIPSNPAQDVTVPKPPPHEDRVITDDEFRAILAELPWLGHRAFVLTLGLTGLRWAEAAALPDRLVDLTRQELRVRWTIDKKGRLHEMVKSESGYRTVPIPDELREMIERWWEERTACRVHEAGGGFLFTGKRQAPLQYDHFRDRVWIPAVERAGLVKPLPTQHDLRHYYGTKLGESGMGERNIGALLGHSPNSDATKRYVQETESRFSQARKVFDKPETN